MGPDARWIGNEAGATRESEWSVIPVAGIDDRPDEKNPAASPVWMPRPRTWARSAGSPRSRTTGGRLIWYPGPGRRLHPARLVLSRGRGRRRSRRSTISSTSTTPPSAATPSSCSISRPDKRGRIHENDVRRLKELGDRLRSTFLVDLAAKATFDVEVPGPPDGVDTSSGKAVSWTATGHSLSATSGKRRLSMSSCSKSRSIAVSASNPSPSTSGTVGMEGDRARRDDRLEEAPALPARQRLEGPAPRPGRPGPGAARGIRPVPRSRPCR